MRRIKGILGYFRCAVLKLGKAKEVGQFLWKCQTNRTLVVTIFG